MIKYFCKCRITPKGFHMTKRNSLLTGFLLAIILIITLSGCNKDFDDTNNEMENDLGSTPLVGIINPDSEVRGVWIASTYNIDYPSKTDLSAAELKAELDSILDTCTEVGLNTIFFQVRPTADALYASDIFPVSSVLNSSGALPFDPLDYLVTEGHRRNIYVHAWVNPLRVTMNSHDIDALPEMSPARKNPDWVVPYDDGKLYFNAGIPEVWQLVADGVEEIVKKYDVDGIVFDDYFYPYPVYDENGIQIEFDDIEEFEKYGAEYENIGDWRRDNINKMVKLCYETVHATDPDCVFGISPYGVWQNNDGTNGGSNTSSFEAYKSLYCDATAWIDGGYIDYICPQIYWEFGTTVSPYDTVLRWWNTALDGSSVKLYVAHASYRYEEGEWTSPEGELTEQITFARSEKYYRGSISYGYDEIKRNIRGAADDLKAAYKNEIIYTDIVSSGAEVSVNSPLSGSVMTSDKTYIIGQSDPYYPLTVNGEKVGRTKSGYFSLYVTLKKGENKFVFEQNDKTYEYTLTYSTSTGTTSETKKEPTIIDSLSVVSTYPSSSVATAESTVWVSCVAPYGSSVNVTIGGITTYLPALEQPKQTWTANGYVGVIYGANITLPKAADGEIIDCGNIQYTAYHAHGTMTATGANVRVLGKNALIAVRATVDYANLKISESSSYYNDYTVQSEGMTDYAVSLLDGYYKLRMGGYISIDEAEETTDISSRDPAKISSVTVTSGEDETHITLECADNLPYNGCIEDGRFVVTFYNADAETAPEARMTDNPLFKSCTVVRLDDKVRYSFELYDVANFYGFDLHYTDDTIVVTLRNPVKLDLDSDTPLSGIHIVLDAGHGGYDNGASGANKNASEKDLNLSIVLSAAEKLRTLGADVTLSRADDTAVALAERMDLLEQLEPDLCVSIHQNSMNYNVDITRVRGTLALWCMDGGLLLSDTVGRAMAESLGRNYRGNAYQALALCRNPKFPAALIETGFITSVEEYEQISSVGGIESAAEGVVKGILDYYKKQAEYIAAQ